MTKRSLASHLFAPLRWIGRALKRVFRPRRRLRLTREGRVFIAITIGIGLASVNTGNNLLYLVLGWMLSLIIASGVLSDMSMRSLQIRRRAPRRIFANRPFLMEISVKNLKQRLASYSIEVEDLVFNRALDKRCYFLKIPPKRTQRTSYRHTFSRRGHYPFDGFRIGTTFPFALFHKSRNAAAPSSIVVYPEIRPIALPTPKARLSGENATNQIGRRGEFFGLREYRDGDDRRSIHWRSSARSGHLLVREFEREAQRQATIFIDNGMPDKPSTEQTEALERAIRTAASLAASYLRVGYAVRLVARGCSVPFAAGVRQLDQILRTLAQLPNASLSSPCSFAEPPTRRGDNVLVVPPGIDATGRPPGCQTVDLV